jgi:hypothetical protein
MILNIKYIANWKAIKVRKTKIIKKNNQRENSKCLPHTYRVGDKVLLERNQPNKLERPYEGPYLVQQVNTNGTLRLKMGAVTDTVNIRQIVPYKPPSTNRGGKCNMPFTRKRKRQS